MRSRSAPSQRTTLAPKGLLALLVVAVMALGFWRSHDLPPLSAMRFAVRFATTPTASPTHTALVPSTPATLTFSEIARNDIPMPADAPAAHASFLIAPSGQQLQVFWFAGSREGAQDVQIMRSFYDTAAPAPQWTTPQVAVNRQMVCQYMPGLPLLNGCPIRRLGNPVVWVDGLGRTHLYVVATTYLGGWAASRILHLQEVRGSFKPLGFLPLSPLFNISHLVRGPAVPLQDGGALLPAYFELGIKYPVAVRLDHNGYLVQAKEAVVSMQQGAPLDATLQPQIVATSSSAALAYLRDGSPRQQLRILQTLDAGATWQPMPPPSQTPALINPDSAVAAVRLRDGSIVLIHNPQVSGRHRLIVERSPNGLDHWQLVATLASESPHRQDIAFNEYSYPSAVVVGDQLHITYTHQRRWIRHVVLQLPPTPKSPE